MRFLEEARDELSGAALWYEERGAGLGTRFLDEVEQALEHLAKNPAIGARWEVTGVPAEVEVRRLPLRRFPYLIVYVLAPDPTIVAVAHAHREPGYWSDRLS
jgi:plasmid stabilization system protein ParE